MTDETGDRFEVLLGRIRSASGERRVTGFFRQVGRAARRASPARSRRAVGGRSRQAFARRVLVKVSIVKMAGRGAGAQRLHLGYIGRDGAGRDGERAMVYDAERDEADLNAFRERGAGDRHQFRIVVSPEDAADLSSLKDFTRDLVAGMERDLDTKLDWVAADHFDTAQPHTHLVISGRREDGPDLVMPRRYVSHGIRERAQGIVERELGPVSEIDGKLRVARMVTQERLTEIDRRLFRRTMNGIVEVQGAGRLDQAWRGRLEKQRLAYLEKLCLAERLGGGRWRVRDDAERTLRDLGERGDIIKAMHRAMGGRASAARMGGALRFDPLTEEHDLTGRVAGLGVIDDVSDRSYLVVEGIDGRTRFVDGGTSGDIAELRHGMIVTVEASTPEPRSSDRTIGRVARANGGRYSPALHLAADQTASPGFVEAHVRRLEALRRAGHAERNTDGSWKVPQDYMERATAYERAVVSRRPPALSYRSTQTLDEMRSAVGRTWLDDRLAVDGIPEGSGRMATKLASALRARRAFLAKEGLLAPHESCLSAEALNELERRDVAAAAEAVRARLGKPVGTADQGVVEGTYRERLDRPSGRFAVVERAKDFVLVPWRPVMERRLGRNIIGRVGSGGISWDVSGASGQSLHH